MKFAHLLLTVAPFALVVPGTAFAASEAPASDQGTTKDSDMVTTGVARGRDRLDSATSTSALKDSEVYKLAPRSLGEIFRIIPGMRAEAPGGEGNASITIRGLPLALGGAKFLQIQEDGLPVLEFGDISFGTADNFIRADLNLAAVESIRGGSASTFASNSPGGIINLISKTGEVEGGNIQATAGLDYEEYRTDFDYGAKLSEDLRFHIGGFYRVGEGPRHAGFQAFNGGQLKLNVTKTFSSGYIRFYGKLLDDRTPSYDTYPVQVSGTNDNPKFSNVANFDILKDTLLTRNFLSNLTLGANNTPERHDMKDGIHAKVKSFGVESQFELGDWIVTEKFRYADISGTFMTTRLLGALTPAIGSAQAIANDLGGAGATLRYATGPNQNALIDPASLEGNGLLAKVTLQDNQLDSLNNITNDLRISRVWDLGKGDLTTTFGFYKSHQDIKMAWTWSSLVMDIRGDGSANLINVYRADGTPVTQDGYYGFGTSYIGGARRSLYDLEYGVNAPYGSFNYHVGKLSIGGSLRYDYGTARGSVYGSELGGGRVGTTSYDVNGDGVISDAETRVSIYPLSQPGPVHYNYNYLSYSTGVNYRIAEPLAVFGRYSRGARANAERLMFGGGFVNVNDGSLLRTDAAYDPVQQAEIGVKYRQNGLTLNLTGFWAKTKEHNVNLDRRYRAYGLEFEGGVRHGPWSLTGSATWTKSEITEDLLVATTVGNTPRHQPDLIYQVTPQYSNDQFSVGAFIVGQTSSYAQDVNQLKLPGFTTVNAFVQYRPVERVTLSVNSNNLFNAKGFLDVDQASIPASGIVTARSITGRTISTSIRFSF